MSRQHRELTNNLWQLTNSWRVKLESDRVVSLLVGANDMLVAGGQSRIELLKHLKRIDHVFGGDGFAVVPSGRGPQPKTDPGKICRIARRLGNEPIFACHFVQGRCHERVVDEADAFDQIALYAGDHHVEAVVGADHGLAYRSAARRVGVHIVEMLKRGCVLKIAEQRDAMRRRWRIGDCGG